MRLRRNDEGRDLFAPGLAGDTGDCYLSDRGVGLEDDLHLSRVDVEAARDDQLLETAADGEGAVFADLPHVAGHVETVGGECFLRRRFVAPVALENLAALDQDLVLVSDPPLHTRKWNANASRLPGPVVRIGDHDPTFGDAVALDWWLTQQPLAPLEERRGRGKGEGARASVS